MFFFKKQERTAWSPLGWHMGNYEVMLDCLWQNDATLANIIVKIAYTSLMTSCPLSQWQQASQIMSEKGKGQFI